MLTLQVIQARYGDSFILEYGNVGAPRFLLIDGGPSEVFDRHLRGRLEWVADQGGELDAVVVSHVDSDHIVGILDLAADLRRQREANEEEFIAVHGLWHNAFDRSIDPSGDVQSRVMSALALTSPQIMHDGMLVLNGIGQGNRLRILAQQLAVPINQGFPNGLVCTDDAPDGITLDNLTISIVGPSRANLEELRREWTDWLDRFEPDLASGDPALMANADKSVPNLSSIMFLAEADGRTILFTGDGRSDHLLGGLRDGGHLDEDDRLHVDVLKVMHHGSNRNVTRTFFRKVTADTYVISANGHPDNPDLSTLIWLVEAAKEQGRHPLLVFTNEEPAVRKLQEEYPADTYGYDLEVMPRHFHFKRIELA